MNLSEEVVVGWGEPLEEGEVIKLEDLQSKIGGEPLWLVGESNEHIPELNCQKCTQPLKFLLQMYAPVDAIEEAYHRAQLPEKNDVLIYDEATDMNKLLKENQIAVPDNILLPEVLMIATEMISSEKQVAILETEDDEDEMDDSDEDEELKDETFKAYKRFDKHSPSHIVRYCFSKTSKPLFYSDYDQFPSECKTPCENCGAPRIFEFQINSQILAQVKPLLSLDWGVVAFYTCSKCCTSNDSKYLKEVCEIQIAPDEIDSHNMKRLQERKLKEFEKDLKDAGPDMLLDDEIALIKQQIKDEESEDRYTKQANNKRQAKEDTMEEKSGKLFDDELSDDDWA